MYRERVLQNSQKVSSIVSINRQKVSGATHSSNTRVANGSGGRADLFLCSLVKLIPAVTAMVLPTYGIFFVGNTQINLHMHEIYCYNRSSSWK